MKRINQETNQIFKRGDLRHDGYVFYKYTRTLKRDGNFREMWLSPEAYERDKKNAREKRMRNYQRTTVKLFKGWKHKLHSKELIAECREVWAHMLENPLTQKALRSRCASDEVYALLSPYTTDYVPNTQTHGN